MQGGAVVVQPFALLRGQPAQKIEIRFVVLGHVGQHALVPGFELTGKGIAGVVAQHGRENLLHRLLDERAALTAVLQQKGWTGPADVVVIREVGAGLNAGLGDEPLELKLAPFVVAHRAGPTDGQVFSTQAFVASLEEHVRRNAQRFAQGLEREVEGKGVVREQVLRNRQALKVG